MIAWAFPALALCGIFSAYALKVRFSGSHLNSIKFFCCLIFNGFFVVTHIEIIEKNDFLFLGHRPDIILEYPFIGWTAFLCILAHSFALPIKREVK